MFNSPPPAQTGHVGGSCPAVSQNLAEGTAGYQVFPYLLDAAISHDRSQGCLLCVSAITSSYGHEMSVYMLVLIKHVPWLIS